MNEDLTMRWINKIVGRFAFSKGLLSWDFYESHLTDPLKNLLTEMNNKSVIVTVWCTNYIQALDVVWKKPFKSRIAEFYDEWLIKGVHQYTETGNLKVIPKILLVMRVLETLKETSKRDDYTVV